MPKKAIDLITRVGIVLNDVDQTRWPETTMFSEIDAGQRNLIRRIPYANQARSTVQLVAGSIQQAPADCLSIINIPKNTNGAVITPIDRLLLDAEDPEWVNGAGDISVVHVMYTGNPREFITYPVQPSPSGEVDITYGAFPTAITDVQDALSVTDEFFAPVTDYVAYRLLQEDGDNTQNANKAIELYNSFEDFVAEITGIPRPRSSISPQGAA